MMDQIQFYLRSGLWRLAEELVPERESGSVNAKLKRAKDFFRNLASDPSNKFISTAVSTLWVQSWLATSILRRLPSSETESIASVTDLDVVRQEAEFKIILNSLIDSSTNLEIFQELTLLFSQVIRADKIKNPAQCLSTEAHNFLCHSFMNNPISTNSVVQKLICLWCLHFKGTDDELQGVYKEALWHCIQTLENERNKDSTLTLFCMLFSLISLLQVSEEKQQSLLEWLCPRLVYLFESGILPRQLAYLAFLSREKPTWLRVLSSYEDEYYDRNVEGKDVAMLERICLRLVDTKGDINVKEIFHRAVISDRHFIEDIVDLNCKLLVNGCDKEVFNCISHPLLNKSWPLMILHSWSCFANREEIFATLNALIKKYKEVDQDEVFTRLCTMLEGQLKVVEWCKKNRRGKPTSNSEMLVLAKDHSTLEMMHRSTNLAEVDWLQVKQILEHNYSLYTSELKGEDLLPVQWDIVTFNGFCILTTAFKAILASMEIQSLCKKINKSHDSMKTDVKPIIPAYFARTYPSVVLHHPSLNTEGEYSDEHIVQMAYTEQVTKRLQKLKQMICNIHQLNFRIELLENVFSLLFLRYKDLQDEMLSDSAGEDDDAEHSIDKSLIVEESLLEMPTNTTDNKNQSFAIDTNTSVSGFPSPKAISVSPQLQVIPIIDAQVCSTPVGSAVEKPNFSLCTDSKHLVSVMNESWPQTYMSHPELEVDGCTPHTQKTLIDIIPSSPQIANTVGIGDTKQSPESSQSVCTVPTSKTELGKSEETELKIGKRPRTHSAATSMASVLGNAGFICNEYLVRDLLHCLKECLVDTSAAYYSSLSLGKEDLNSQIPSTIGPELVKQSMTRLSQYVSEAAWRLQLLTDTNFTRKVGIMSHAEFSGISSPLQSELVYLAEESDTESEEERELTEMYYEKTKARKLSMKKSETDKSSESGSQSTTTGGGSASGSSYRKTRRSKVKVHHQTLLSSSTATVNLLLSSPMSLVAQCLTKGDLIKAQQVVKMCGMEDSSLAVEVKFTNAYQNLRHNLQLRSTASEVEHQVKTTAFAHQQEITVKTSSAFEAIKLAASAGVQSMAFMGDVESFLSVTTFPSIPGTSTIIKEFPCTSNLLRSADNNAAIAAIDLALTMGSSHQHSVSLLDIAIKHCSALQVPQPAPSPTTSPMLGNRNRQALGFISFTHQMIQLVKEVNQQPIDGVSRLFPQNVSVCKIITSDQFPMHKKVFTESISFWNTLQASANEFQANLTDERNNSRVLISKGIVSIPNDKSNMTAHIAFKKLLKGSRVVPLRTDFSKRKETRDATEMDELHYLEQLYVYLKLLTSLLIQNLPLDKGLPGPATYFDVLDESPADLIGRLIFEYGVLPAKLEPIANRLKLDLPYYVVRNCCPRIPAAISYNTPIGTLAATWGRVVLNQVHEQWTNPVRHPEVAVRSLLSDLLETLRQDSNCGTSLYTLNQEQASSFASHSTVKSILAETQELAFIDLKLLASGDETLVFYANLTNLIWIHSLISFETIVVHSSSLEEKQGIVINSGKETLGLLSNCSSERLLAQKSVGYNLGQLGFVSLYDLENHLLGRDLSAHSSVSLLLSLDHLTGDDFWNSLAKSTDPRALFSLTNGERLSPKVQVLYMENIDSQLDNSMVEFFNYSVHFDDESRLIIPERLSWYREHAMENQAPESQIIEQGYDEASRVADVSVEATENLTSLVDFLRDNTSGQLQRRLISCASNVKNEVTVIVDKQLYEFGVTLEYPNPGQESNYKVDSCIPTVRNSCEDIWTSHTIEDQVIKFLERHCWLLSVLVRKIHQDQALHASPAISHNSDDRMHCLEQLFQSDSIGVLKSIYHDRFAVAALHIHPNRTKLWDWLHKLTEEKNWATCLDVLWALPKSQLMSDPKLQTLNDFIANELASKPPSEDNLTPWQYCEYIGNISLQASCVLKNVHQWPGVGCNQALRVLIDDTRRHLLGDTKSKLQLMLHKVQTYDQILVCCTNLDMKTWYDVSILSKNNPTMILKSLIRVKECKLCIEWAELQHISTRTQHMVDSQFLILLLDTYPSDFSAASKLLQSVLPIQAAAVCEDLLHQLKSISSLGFIVNFLLASCSSVLDSDDLLRYRHLSIGIQMLSLVPVKEQTEYMDLIHQPRLIVEQFVMITRLDILERMLDMVRPTLSQLPIGSPMSLNSIDSLLRQYAEKALDFRVIRAQTMPYPTETEEKLLISLSMGSNCSEDFVMPVNVPTKDQWVPNDAVTECMCCDAVAFSMFNRRHHCRRCGRVICGSCSAHRTKVPGYGDLAVRVCDTCYDCIQNAPLDSDQPSLVSSREQLISLQGSFNSFSRDSPWRLSLNESHNSTVREEFGYEHAPSVSLCLAILKLHSEQTAYPRFLLDSCDRMLQLLQPVRPGMLNREVDHGLVIRMVRALIVAAKVKYARSGLNTGVAHCDQLLSQADLLSELVRSDCTSLIPGEALNGHALRRLRDRLVEEELWPLAMDVSTKGGLDRIGVWAAWGKAALRSGRWEEAKQKFSHCLDKVSDAPRPLRNPPLLKEIIHILETGAYAVDQKVLRQAEKIRTVQSQENKSGPVPSPALTVLHTLASLKSISQGKYPQSSSPSNMVIIGPKLDPLFYEECQYYLKMYGSHAGILAFYLGHDDLAATLRHVLQQKVDPTVFFEHVYIPCLRRGLITNLHHDLQAMDPSLELWKVYLCYTCCHLERLGFLNVLYHVQLYMKDYIRAAMTCIRFYHSGARNYSDLATNIEYLHTAHKHLEAELFDSTWGLTGHHERVSCSGSLLPMKLEPRDVDRHINTISRQIEVTKFLHSCEKEQRPVLELVPEVFDHLSAAGDDKQEPVPTLFGNNAERVQLAVLMVLCGKNVEEGFGTAFRISQDYHLKSSQVYSLAGRRLSREGRLSDVEQLIRCIRSSGMSNTTTVCEEVLSVCVRVRADQPEPGDIEPLVKLMTDTGNKISAYIDCRQLKAAYLQAVKFNRLGDVRRILRESERLGQTVIRNICLKKLSQQPNSPQAT